jgi:septum formation protein
MIRLAPDAVKAQYLFVSPSGPREVFSPKNHSESSMKLILASTSLYRVALLRRLRVPFDIADPQVDEALIEGELPQDRARRLAFLKADTVSAQGVLAIGADQVACLNGHVLRKPHTIEAAVAQLLLCSGQVVRFWTAVSIRNTASLWCGERLVPCDVSLREISEPEAERYVQLDDPLNCAGSFKWESLGISLFESIDTDDPTALEGLPLIAVCDLLREADVPLPLLSEKI